MASFFTDTPNETHGKVMETVGLAEASVGNAVGSEMIQGHGKTVQITGQAEQARARVGQEATEAMNDPEAAFKKGWHGITAKNRSAAVAQADAGSDVIAKGQRADTPVPEKSAQSKGYFEG
ncbi:hypothetical protein IWQ60_012181 [Tieghemiomyces parasiticus]|uniref:Uncharacterized protein n=1 Tax=Tieghemiomyces parasiticus TaxID=78921 RepID=A0A9W8DHT5_9FUNG|nr:hypothetical protein IWQ60_012181 [Tieghemiomyces parasiticus]